MYIHITEVYLPLNVLIMCKNFLSLTSDVFINLLDLGIIFLQWINSRIFLNICSLFELCSYSDELFLHADKAFGFLTWRYITLHQGRTVKNPIKILEVAIQYVF